jgi:hypothetical protein
MMASYRCGLYYQRFYHLHFLGEMKISPYVAKFLKILRLIVFLYLHFKQPAVLVTSEHRLCATRNIS